MSTIDDKRTAFHSYLASSGVISALSKALIKLYEEPNKPDDPVNFVRRHMGSEDFFIVGNGKCAKDPNVEDEELILSSLTEKTMEVNITGVAENTSEVIEDIDRPSEDTEGPSGGNVEVVEGKDDDDVNAEVQLQGAFEKLKLNEDCKSLLKTHLTDELLEKFKNELDDGGGASFFECIKSGVENPDSVVGIYAIDYQSYDKFNEIFDPVIEEYHGFGRDVLQPTCDWGDSNGFTFESFDENDIVVSLRISCVRNLLDYPLVCRMSEEDLNASFVKIKTIIERFSDESSKGIFYSFSDLTQEQETELMGSGILMDNSNPNLTAINLYQQWPLGRGVFVSESIIIQVNGEDHLKFISNQSSSHFGKTYQRLVDAVNFFELTFARHDRLGWLTFDPTNLGTALSLKAELKLPKLHSNPAKLQEIIAAHSMLQLDTGAESTYTLCNQSTMGSTEFDLVKQFYDTMKEVIECERNEE